MDRNLICLMLISLDVNALSLRDLFHYCINNLLGSFDRIGEFDAIDPLEDEMPERESEGVPQI